MPQVASDSLFLGLLNYAFIQGLFLLILQQILLRELLRCFQMQVFQAICHQVKIGRKSDGNPAKILAGFFLNLIPY